VIEGREMRREGRERPRGGTGPGVGEQGKETGREERKRGKGREIDGERTKGREGGKDRNRRTRKRRQAPLGRTGMDRQKAHEIHNILQKYQTSSHSPDVLQTS